MQNSPLENKPKKGFKVSVLGASGGIGQPLSMLLKFNPKITELSLYDVIRTNGVAADLSHCCTPTKVKGFVGTEEFPQAVSQSDIVIILCGVSRKPGMTRDDLFNINAKIVKTLAELCSSACPEAMFLIVSNPVNSNVPIFTEVMKSKGVYNSKKVCGLTTLDVVRANTFVAENQKLDVTKVKVPVIGGHAGTTILPLLSQVPDAKFTDADIAALTQRIQFGGDEVVKAKDGAGSATLSMAYAAQQFTSRLLDAMDGEKNVIECAFVENNITPSPFFSTPLLLGPNGIEEVLPFGDLSPFEKASLDNMLPDLIKQVNKGLDFAKQ